MGVFDALQAEISLFLPVNSLFYAGSLCAVTDWNNLTNNRKSGVGMA